LRPQAAGGESRSLKGTGFNLYRSAVESAAALQAAEKLDFAGFVTRARLQPGRKYNKKMMGFSPCRMYFGDFNLITSLLPKPV
jgi:hypothetical protein